MAAERGADLGRLEARLGHAFSDRAVLLRALTHTSHAHEAGGEPDNEALEFFGDALLGFLIAESLLQRFPDADEGALSKMKAFLVSAPTLAKVAKDLKLAAHLRLGKTERGVAAGVRQSILADGLEALLAAVHLDAGETAARAVVARLFGPLMQGLDRATVEEQDYKTGLQEALQAAGRPTPRYRVDATEGPPHMPLFHVELLIEGEVAARASGGSKKEAEQAAAKEALRSIRRKAAAP
ncbi:MAG TPA: ribonuclease III [Dongiaceae bacterium]|nr:ribonuclease III [Dongiaceae bacterium]